MVDCTEFCGFRYRVLPMSPDWRRSLEYTKLAPVPIRSIVGQKVNGINGQKVVNMRSPVAEACGGTATSPRECAEKSVDDCGGINAAIAWCRTWTHRPFFREAMVELRKIQCTANTAPA